MTIPVIRMAAGAADNGVRKLAGKLAVVTGSTDGIGLAIARRLCQDGAQVMISSRKQSNVDSAVKQLRDEGLPVAGIVCHVAKQEHRASLIEETIKQLGGIDILVSNAAVNPHVGPLLDTPELLWDKTFDVNVKSAFYLCKEVVPHMEKRGGGNVVFVSSVAGFLSHPLIGAYCITKTALLGLTKVMALELVSKNIRVNCLAPGFIDTKFSKVLLEHEHIRTQIFANLPMNRAGTAEECAGAASFLVSEDSSYMTGETVTVSGGLPTRL